jgi:hypothetical protein
VEVSHIFTVNAGKLQRFKFEFGRFRGCRAWFRERGFREGRGFIQDGKLEGLDVAAIVEVMH